ncbi:MAG: hypothetical protein AB7H86_11240 [Blastocatellales bacterium]
MNSRMSMLPALITATICLATVAGCSRYMAPKDYKDPDVPGYTDPNDKKIPGQTASIGIQDDLAADNEFTVREEIRRRYQLNPGATVYVSRISGQVKIETADIADAEMLLVRTAKKKDDLQYQQFGVEQSPENLSIYTASDSHSVFSSIRSPESEIRQRVILRIPRKVNLEAGRISGGLTAGQIEGRVELRNIQGRVKVDRALGQSELYGLNGEADVTFGPLNGRGIDVGGISGNLIMRFEGPVNADMRIRGVSGKFQNDLDQSSDKSESSRPGWKMIQVGGGGSEIDIRGISGNLTLTKAVGGK